MENDKGYGMGVPCGAALDARCERQVPDLCARHAWRMAAIRLLEFARSRGEYTEGRRTPIIEGRAVTLCAGRGCVTAFAEVRTIGGVTLRDAILHVVAAVDPSGQGPVDPATADRLAPYDGATVRAAATETLIRIRRAQPNQE
ncbi:hypothetical protein CA236_11310 [Sphingomonas sp. ABOLG]|mgnify:CR=1 FL=1|jgi:hypothetical protein|uniref:hypothetical protein n=1 Tax=Sphingomonas sp. ABOLG TaxID=1985880 RepID=UPI000F7D83C5|nr:hypothetical protein [Sphingomonas sp. ABOLG]RSV17310.1 hypothetical protein CA236_11310 [Sphingomonas sp. ABOLG]